MNTVDKLGRRRPVKSCTECVRSKTKCDRLSPCSACVKKGKAALCAAADDTALPADDIFDENGAVIANGDELSDAARAEFSSMKDSFTALQARLQRMEALLNALPSERRPAKRPRMSAPASDANKEEEAEKAVELKMLEASESEGAQPFTGPGMYPFHGPDRDTAILPPTVPNVLVRFPARAAFASIAPTRLESAILIEHCMSTLGPLHPVINAAARRQHLAHFWIVESPLQLEHCYSSWLASYFAQVAVGARLATNAIAASLGADRVSLQRRAADLTEAALACLYHANILHNRSLVALQAVAYLALSGRTASTFTAITALVDHAVVGAQHLQLGGDSPPFVASDKPSPDEQSVRMAALEVRKRVIRALAIANWMYSTVPFITPDRIKGGSMETLNAAAGPLEDSTSPSYLNFMYKLACIVYKFRFGSPTKHEVQAYVQSLDALSREVPTDDAVSQVMCRVHVRYWMLRLLRLRPAQSDATQLSLAREILLEVSALASLEITHWAVLHQVCAAALVLIGSWRRNSRPDEELITLAESFFLGAAAANSIAVKSLEAISKARRELRDSQDPTTRSKPPVETPTPSTSATTSSPSFPLGLPDLFDPSQIGPSPTSTYPWLDDTLDVFGTSSLGLEGVSGLESFAPAEWDPRWLA